jgi:hypothetical protein
MQLLYIIYSLDLGNISQIEYTLYACRNNVLHTLWIDITYASATINEGCIAFAPSEYFVNPRSVFSEGEDEKL